MISTQTSAAVLAAACAFGNTIATSTCSVVTPPRDNIKKSTKHVPSTEDTTKVNVSIRHSDSYGNEWIDVQVPSSHYDECLHLIRNVCEYYQNVWQYGYSGNKTERARKESLNLPPENNLIRLRISYTISPCSTQKPDESGLQVSYTCGFFCSCFPRPVMRDCTTGDLVTIPVDRLISVCHTCLETVALSLEELINDLITGKESIPFDKLDQVCNKHLMATSSKMESIVTSL